MVAVAVVGLGVRWGGVGWGGVGGGGVGWGRMGGNALEDVVGHGVRPVQTFALVQQRVSPLRGLVSPVHHTHSHVGL